MQATAAAPAIDKTGLNAIRAASATGLECKQTIRASPLFSYRPAAMGLCSKKYDFAGNAEFFGNTPEAPSPPTSGGEFRTVEFAKHKENRTVDAFRHGFLVPGGSN